MPKKPHRLRSSAKRAEFNHELFRAAVILVTLMVGVAAGFALTRTNLELRQRAVTSRDQCVSSSIETKTKDGKSIYCQCPTGHRVGMGVACPKLLP
ncbi:MAG: hypothetical protein M3Q81_03435 [bacterium]|nr:hypothetical protein [bacterium]